MSEATHIKQKWGIRERFSTYLKALRNLGFLGFLARAKARRTGGSIPSKYSQHKVNVRRGTSDMLVFDQIFIDREYRCLDGLKNIREIVDVGANVGYSSAYLLSYFPNSRVVAIEPDPANYHAMVANLAPWGDRVISVHGALWSEPAMLDFHQDTTQQGKEWGRKIIATGAGAVRAFDMPFLMAANGMPVIDLLKIDIEGAEEAVFSAPKLAWLDQVKNIVIELHGDNCSSTFMRAIERRGYHVSRCDELTVCLG